VSEKASLHDIQTRALCLRVVGRDLDKKCAGEWLPDLSPEIAASRPEMLRALPMVL
jgi:hypothetical protein